MKLKITYLVAVVITVVALLFAFNFYRTLSKVKEIVKQEQKRVSESLSDFSDGEIGLEKGKDSLELKLRKSPEDIELLLRLNNIEIELAKNNSEKTALDKESQFIQKLFSQLK